MPLTWPSLMNAGPKLVTMLRSSIARCTCSMSTTPAEICSCWPCESAQGMAGF